MGKFVAVLDSKDETNERNKMTEEEKKALEDKKTSADMKDKSKDEKSMDVGMDEMKKMYDGMKSMYDKMEKMNMSKSKDMKEKNMDEDEGMKKKESKDMEEKDMKKKESMDAADAPVFDAAEFSKNLKNDMRKEFADKDKLSKRLTPYIGTFDHAEMDLKDVAVYAAEKLGVTCDSKDAVLTVNSYLSGRESAPVATTTVNSQSFDSSDSENSVAAYLKGDS